MNSPRQAATALVLWSLVLLSGCGKEYGPIIVDDAAWEGEVTTVAGTYPLRLITTAAGVDVDEAVDASNPSVSVFADLSLGEGNALAWIGTSDHYDRRDLADGHSPIADRQFFSLNLQGTLLAGFDGAGVQDERYLQMYESAMEKLGLDRSNRDLVRLELEDLGDSLEGILTQGRVKVGTVRLHQSNQEQEVRHLSPSVVETKTFTFSVVKAGSTTSRSARLR